LNSAISVFHIGQQQPEWKGFAENLSAALMAAPSFVLGLNQSVRTTGQPGMESFWLTNRN
jgi:hypothetical protein